ncbi:response regulator transcription factor [Candidatus Peregrinibacteria bacterium]|nr:response regulator transcription factor [Candidatus Peregrinibacteria bacterium]
MRILVVEDEKKIADFIKEILEAEGNEVTLSTSTEEVLEHNYVSSHDLMILDLMLSGKQGGLDLVKMLKKDRTGIPIIVLTALNQINTKVELFNAGVDDYLTKPFEALELLARIKSVYRRYLEGRIENEMVIDDMIFQRKEHLVIRAGKKIFLTVKECELLCFLIENAGKIVRSEDILKRVWNTRVGFHSNILQATVRRLRKKLDDGFEKKYIKNVHGVGYCFEK